jgi:hypothetical protein
MRGEMERLVQQWRNLGDAAKHAGRRYEAQRSISSATECYGQMYGFHACANDLANLLEMATGLSAKETKR